MSAFVVSDKTISQIVTFAKLHAPSMRSDYSYACNDFLKHAGHVEPGLIGQALLNLNAAAVDARYGKGEAAKFRDSLVYQHKSEPAKPIQVYKSLGCLIYQCSEGDVPSEPLYKALDTFSNQLAHALVCQMPEYDTATWDAA